MGGHRVRSGRRTIGSGAIRMVVFVVYLQAPRSSYLYALIYDEMEKVENREVEEVVNDQRVEDEIHHGTMDLIRRNRHPSVISRHLSLHNCIRVRFR
jgi:hypothetical protein